MGGPNERSFVDATSASSLSLRPVPECVLAAMASEQERKREERPYTRTELRILVEEVVRRVVREELADPGIDMRREARIQETSLAPWSWPGRTNICSVTVGGVPKAGRA